MIRKLHQRIFWIIMVSLSIVILGTIILSTFLNYNNTINLATSMIDRFIGGEPKKNPNDNIENKIKPEIAIEGVYDLLIEDSTIVKSSNAVNNKEIEKYACKVAKGNGEKGIIGKYIYKAKKINNNRKRIILIEDENTILQIKIMFLFAVSISIISIIVIYVIAKKVSRIIVKPVEETFDKQKQFISDASHELKTPLAVIEANADVLENNIGSNKWIRYIQNEADSMDKLINELLLLTKIENIETIKEYKQLNLSKEVEIILSMFESIAYENQVSITSKISENIIMNGNKEDIEHIVSTLVDNAIKHAKFKKEVEVGLRKEKNEIILEVKNMGDPIPEEERQKIFERFYRIDKSRNRKEKRYGLGLSIAKSTIEKYKGKIELYYKDNFTVFKVTIPN